MIAFDIDGCVNCIKEDIMRLGKEYFVVYDVTFNKKGYYLREIWQGAPDNIYENFWDEFGYEIYTNPPQDGVCEVIDYLKKHNIDACYITTRDISKKYDGVSFDKITDMWLRKYHLDLPVYYRRDKDVIAKELNVRLMIEDKPANIIKLQKVTNVLIYDHPYNKDMEGIHISRWSDVLKYL